MPCGGLVDAEPADRRRGAAGLAHGGVAEKAEASGVDPFGPGLAVHQHGLGCVHPGSQSGALDERTGQPSRQHCGRKLLLVA